MEIIRTFEEIPNLNSILCGQLKPYDTDQVDQPEQEEELPNLTSEEEKKLLAAFNSGQLYLAEQVSYVLQQIKISIELNDGNFCGLIDELEEGLRNL